MQMDRDERRKRLEEKRSKLAEIKARRQGGDDSPMPSESTVDTSLSYKDTLSMASEIIGEDIRPSPSVTRDISPVPSRLSTSSESRATEFMSKITSLDSVPLDVITFRQVPSVKYSKETQTIVASGDLSDQDADDVDTKANTRKEDKDQKSTDRRSNTAEPTMVQELTPSQKKEIIARQDFTEFLTGSSRLVERVLGGLEEYDPFVDYSRVIGEEDGRMQRRDAVSLNSLLVDERWTFGRCVNSIDHCRQFPELILASYSAINSESVGNVGAHGSEPDGVVCVWSVFMKSRPEYIFTSQSEVTCAAFAAYHPHLVVGGTYNGQVLIWDTRQKSPSNPVQRTPLSSSGHTHPIYCLTTVGTQNSHNLVTVSTDGKVCSWSMAMMGQPQLALNLKVKAAAYAGVGAVREKDVAVTCFGFPDAEVNMFFVGCESGTVYRANLHGSKAGIVEEYKGHDGPLTCLDFHPNVGSVDFSDLYLTSSMDWTVKLWSQKVGGTALCTFDSSGDDYVMAARWSPVHPAVFATVDCVGQLDVWNINDDFESPHVTVNVTSGVGGGLNSLHWSADGKYITVGGSNGHVFVYDVAGEVATPRSEDWPKLRDRLCELSAIYAQGVNFMRG